MAVVTLAVWSYAFVPLRASQDEWWHLKTGKWIWENQSLSRNDIFTYTGENYRWFNHEWLSQLILYGFYSLGEVVGIGPVRGLILFKSVIVTACFGLIAWLIRLRGASWPAVLLMTFAAAEISRRTIYPRPPIFSYLLLAIFLLTLFHWKLGRLRTRWLWLLPPLTVIWGNLHGMVLLAIVAVGAFAAGEILENTAAVFRSKTRSPTDAGPTSLTVSFRSIFTPRANHLWLLLAVTVVAAMAQPSGYHIFFLGRNFTADPLLQQEILEMKPPPFFLQAGQSAQLVFVPGFAAFWFAAAILIPLLVFSRGRLPFGADYLLTGFFLYQAAMHWRLLPLFAIGAAGTFGALLAGITTRISAKIRRLAAGGAMALSVTLPIYFVFFVDENGTFFQRNMALLQGDVMSLDDYPAPLLDFILAADLPDRMFSESNYCGYYMWRLSPERHKLFTDNRFDLFGSRFRLEEKIILAAGIKGDRFSRGGKPFELGWQELLDKYGVNFVVVHRERQPGYHLPEALILSGEWKHVYYYVPPDALARSRGRLNPQAGISVWVRDEPRFAYVHERALAYFKSEHPTYPLPEHLDKMLLDDLGLKDPSTTSSRSSANWRVPIGR